MGISLGTNTLGNDPTKRNKTVLDALGDNDLTNQYQTNLADMLSGKSMDPYKQASREGMVTQANNLRAQTARDIENAGLTGQGVGRQAAMSTEYDILKKLGQNDLDFAVKAQEEKQKGMTAAFNLAESTRRMQKDNLTMFLDAGDFKGLADYSKQVGLPPVDYTALENAKKANDFAAVATMLTDMIGDDPDLQYLYGDAQRGAYSNWYKQLTGSDLPVDQDRLDEIEFNRTNDLTMGTDGSTTWNKYKTWSSGTGSTY